jgi:ferritin-like protein
MARVLRNNMKKKKNNLEQLVELLVQNAARELNTYYYYAILCVYLNGLEEGDIREIVEVARKKNREHFEALVERIYELDGSSPSIIEELDDIPACSPVLLSGDPLNEQEVIHILIEAGRSAVRGYTRLCNETVGKDHGTFMLALRILNEELEHKVWFSQFLGESHPKLLQDSQIPFAAVSK